MSEASSLFPDYEFVAALTPGAQKAAFHVRKDGRDLCLKIILPGYEMERLNREIIALQAIDHANVVRMLEYSTVFIGTSAVATDETLTSALSEATSLPADGFYFSVEFPAERVPSGLDDVRRMCIAGLTLACTGLPVLHAYAGPLCLLSPCFGATAFGVGHSQNLWKFTRERWGETVGGGGGGDAPPRFFSSSLWGTIVYPDEIALAPHELREAILTRTPFSQQVSATSPYTPWTRWDANKHLVNLLCSDVGVNAPGTPDEAIDRAVAVLSRAIELHGQLNDLLDDTAAYHENWRQALLDYRTECEADLEYLRLLLPG